MAKIMAILIVKTRPGDDGLYTIHKQDIRALARAVVGCGIKAGVGCRAVKWKPKRRMKK